MEELQMKKSTLLATSLVCGSLLIGGVSPVFAADLPGEATTEGDVTFTEDDGSDNPGAIDPEGDGSDISGVTVPAGVAGTGTKRIQYVTNFTFGSQKISASNQTYDAKVVEFIPTDADIDPYFMSNFVQVADTSGTQEGWSLKVKATTFNLDKTDRTKDVLKGAELRLSGFREGNATGDGKVDTTILPTNDASKAYKAITDTAETVYSAKKDKGLGLHTLIFGEAALDQDTTTATSTTAGVQLYVPSTAQAKKGNYSADITWTMEAAPL